MADILLVHGSCHGAWCWRDLLPELVALGHRVRAIDLPSHGADPTPVAEITLDHYARAILAALEGPTVVVGHSMAGYPISRAAELDATHFARLVYLAAYVPWPGHSLAEMRKRAPRQPLAQAIRLSENSQSFTIDPAWLADVFYHDCTPEQQAFAAANLCPQAVLPQATKVTLGTTYARVPRSYIQCLRDGAVPVEFQATMARDFSSEDVYQMDTSHSPFFSAPLTLAGIIDQITRQPGDAKI